MPLRWIEEREAREVLADAECQASELPSPITVKPLWGEWLRRWIVTEAADASEDGGIAAPGRTAGRLESTKV